MFFWWFWDNQSLTIQPKEVSLLKWLFWIHLSSSFIKNCTSNQVLRYSEIEVYWLFTRICTPLLHSRKTTGKSRGERDTNTIQNNSYMFSCDKVVQTRKRFSCPQEPHKIAVVSIINVNSYYSMLIFLLDLMILCPNASSDIIVSYSNFSLLQTTFGL